jgi:transposase-like protein
MPRRSDPSKLAVWRERFERFSKAELAVGPFCDREGVSTATFYHWRKKLGLNGRSRSAAERQTGLRTGPAERPSRFQRVTVVSGTSPILPKARVICIQLSCGTRIEVSAEDLDALRAVVAEVVRADCAWEAPGQADCARRVGAASC